MSVLVVDASVAVKWVVPEVHAEAAHRVLSGQRTLLAPDLIWAEVGNVLWKKCRRGELTGELAYEMLRDVRHFPIQAVAIKSLLESAWEVAQRYQISVYDGLYLALALRHNCTLVTDDMQLCAALKDTPLASSLSRVERFH